MIATALVILSRGGSSRPSRGPDGAASSPVPARSGATPALSDETAGEEVEASDEEAALIAQVAQLDAVDGKLASVEKLTRTLELYEAATVYPPWSRSATEGSTPHLLEPNRPVTVGQPFAADADRREIRTDAVLDRWFVGPGERATATLTVTREDPAGAPHVPDAVTMRVERYDPVQQAWPIVAELPVVEAGGRFSAVIDPAAIPALAKASPPPEVRVVVRVEVGEFFKELPLVFRYAVAPSFRVVALKGDRVVGGSLEIAFDVEVHHVLPTLVQAVLYDASGTRPIATYEQQFHPTELGPQVLTVRFFGKVLHDAGVGGRYRIKGLRGHVLMVGGEPSELHWSHPDEPPLLTAASYSSGDFSDAPWSSPEKDLMVARYRALIQQGGI